ncbi:hypothetical protein [Actinoplanes regularis]|uniref:hypothetical protein n=1 Tax=Actinoplanes regularis TaxID=52697 RepID=UPI00249FF3B3|nr:hypothetical protein [Actinoplanes regularis]GLW28899.1 hypothetical protein Areg01_18390 [Actinoplanes regularis]
MGPLRPGQGDQRLQESYGFDEAEKLSVRNVDLFLSFQHRSIHGGQELPEPVPVADHAENALPQGNDLVAS